MDPHSHIQSALWWCLSLSLYALGVTLVLISVSRPSPKSRPSPHPILFLVWTLFGGSFWSLIQIGHIDLRAPPFHFGMTVVISTLLAPVILYQLRPPFTINKVPAHRSSFLENWRSSYKICVNPRMLPPVSGSEHHQALRKAKMKFVLQRVARLAAISSLSFATKRLRSYLISKRNGLVEYSPARESILRPIMRNEITVHILIYRVAFSFFWIIDTMAMLETGRIILALLFVGVIQWDQPEEWPPLFGSPLDAYTLRRFWGKFWHRLFTPAAIVWAQTVADWLNIKSVRMRKVFVPFFVFTLSGFTHLLVGYLLVGRNARGRDFLFVWAMFVATAFEAVVTAAWEYAWKRVAPKGRIGAVLRRCLGYMWVAAFLVWLMPRVIYPEMHHRMQETLWRMLLRYRGSRMTTKG